VQYEKDQFIDCKKENDDPDHLSGIADSFRVWLYQYKD
jgi:hypothetical protein